MSRPLARSNDMVDTWTRAHHLCEDLCRLPKDERLVVKSPTRTMALLLAEMLRVKRVDLVLDLDGRTLTLNPRGPKTAARSILVSSSMEGASPVERSGRLRPGKSDEGPFGSRFLWPGRY